MSTPVTRLDRRRGAHSAGSSACAKTLIRAGHEHFHAANASVKWFRIRTFWRCPVPVAQENLIEISDVSFAYDRRPVLTGINMVIPRGKVVAIMGVSGSGKTTLLRLIARRRASRRAAR